MKEQQINLVLPMPISINEAYSGYVRRHKSNNYKLWYSRAFKKLLNQKKYSIKGDSWLFVEYEFNFSLYTKAGKKRIKDVGNYEKVLSDFLADNIKGFEDHKIKTILLKKIDNENSYVNIRIKETV